MGDWVQLGIYLYPAADGSGMKEALVLHELPTMRLR